MSVHHYCFPCIKSEFRCQSIFSRGGRPRRRRLTDDAEAMGNDLDPVLCTVGPATAHRRPYAIQLLGRLSPRTFHRQRARRAGSVRPSCSHSGNESRMGSACPAPWQRWLDQVYSHGSATIAARTGLASMYLDGKGHSGRCCRKSGHEVTARWRPGDWRSFEKTSTVACRREHHDRPAKRASPHALPTDRGRRASRVRRKDAPGS